MSEDPEPKPDFWSRPIFSVTNLQASIDYYRERLGFELRWRAEDDAAEVHRNGVEVILHCGKSLPSSRVPGVVAAELYDHIKLDALHRDFVRRGATVRAAPFQVSWQPHVHQLEVEDLDGNVLLFWGDLPDQSP